MKKVLSILTMVTVVSFITGSAWAVLITPDVVTTFNHNYLNGSDPYTYNDSATYTHNILGNGFTIGDTLNWATLTFLISDFESDSDDVGSFWFWSWDYREFAQLSTDGIIQSFEIDNGSEANLNLTALTRLAEDGILSVTLTATSGDFYLCRSTLEADYTPAGSSNPVPEPATLLLLGSGLLGLAGFRKKSK